jgi:hypothetical protein
MSMQTFIRMNDNAARRCSSRSARANFRSPVQTAAVPRLRVEPKVGAAMIFCAKRPVRSGLQSSDFDLPDPTSESQLERTSRS